MKLLELPLEILRKIMEMSVVVNTLDQAIMLRLVCKTFDAELTKALCTTRILEVEVPGRQIYLRGERLLQEYLVARTLADRACTHHLSKVINDSIDYIIDERPQDRALRVEYTRALCAATITSHGSYEFGVDIYDVLHATQPSLLWRRAPRRLECSTGENALAATIFLSLSVLSRKLIDNGTEHKLTYYGEPLKIAARRGDVDTIRLIMENCSIIPYSICRAIENAASNGHSAAIELLLDEKYNADIREEADKWYWPTYDTAVCRAAAGGHLNTMLYLIQRANSSGVLYDKHEVLLGMDKRYSKARKLALQEDILRHAADKGQKEIVRVVLDNGVNSDPKRYQLDLRNSPLEAATKNGHEAVVRLLLEKGANPAPQIARTPALAYAVSGGWLRIAQLLIDNGAEANPVKCYRTHGIPLLAAVKRGEADCLRLLLENGATLSMDEEIKSEAYSLASAQGYTTIMGILSEYGIGGSSKF